MLLATSVWARAADAGQRGTLVFKDGNRATGQLMPTGVFQSDRFGEIRYTAQEAEFVAEMETPSAAQTAQARAESVAPVEGTPAVAGPVTGKTPPADKRLLPPWKFSIAGYVEWRNEGSDRDRTLDLSLSGERPHLGKNRFAWSFTYRYLKKRTYMDTRRARFKGEWDYDLSPRWLFLYRPDIEYDGSNLSADAAAALQRARLNYMLMQQQAGLGYRLFTHPKFKSNLSLNWSYIYLKIYHFGYVDVGVPVMLLENELKLPWRISFKQKGSVTYYSSDDQVGWSSEAELTKHLSDRFYLTLRHEYRINSLTGVNDLNKLRFLFGVDF